MKATASASAMAPPPPAVQPVSAQPVHDPVPIPTYNNQATAWDLAQANYNAAFAYDSSDLDEIMPFPSHDESAASSQSMLPPEWWSSEDFFTSF